MTLWGFYTKDRKVRPLTGKVAATFNRSAENIARRILLNEKTQKPIFREFLTYRQISKLPFARKYFDGMNAQRDAIAFARKHGGQLFTEIHNDTTWDPVGFEMGMRVVNRTGKYMVMLPAKSKAQELLVKKRRLVDQGIRLTTKSNLSQGDIRKAKEIQSEINSINYLLEKLKRR